MSVPPTRSLVLLEITCGLNRQSQTCCCLPIASLRTSNCLEVPAGLRCRLGQGRTGQTRNVGEFMPSG